MKNSKELNKGHGTSVSVIKFILIPIGEVLRVRCLKQGLAGLSPLPKRSSRNCDKKAGDYP